MDGEGRTTEMLTAGKMIGFLLPGILRGPENFMKARLDFNLSAMTRSRW